MYSLDSELLLSGSNTLNENWVTVTFLRKYFEKLEDDYSRKSFSYSVLTIHKSSYGDHFYQVLEVLEKS